MANRGIVLYELAYVNEISVSKTENQNRMQSEAAKRFCDNKCQTVDRIEYARDKNLLEVLAGLEPLGPEHQFPKIDDALPPVRDVNL